MKYYKKEFYMYFYILMAGAYDEYNKDIYCSETYYTQEEFENIVVSAFKYVCEDVICNMDDFGRCVERFDPEYTCPYFGIKKSHLSIGLKKIQI